VAHDLILRVHVAAGSSALVLAPIAMSAERRRPIAADPVIAVTGRFCDSGEEVKYRVPGMRRARELAASRSAGDTERFQVFGLGGDDSFVPAPGVSAATGLSIDGGDGADTILGSDGADRILGGDGDDTIVPGGGSDVVFADAGDDEVELRDGAPDVAHGRTATTGFEPAAPRWTQSTASRPSTFVRRPL
jgi:Ca2+-binding RTX toxin-like protein